MRDIVLEIAGVGVFTSSSRPPLVQTAIAPSLVCSDCIISLDTATESADLTSSRVSATFGFALAARAELREVTDLGRTRTLREIFSRCDESLADLVFMLPSIDASTTVVQALEGTDPEIGDVGILSIDSEAVDVTADYYPDGRVSYLHFTRGQYGTHAAPHYGTDDHPLLGTTGACTWPGRRVIMWIDGVRVAVGEIAEIPTVDRDTISITCTRLDGRLSDPPGDGTELVAHLYPGHAWDVDTYAGIAWIQPATRLAALERSRTNELTSPSVRYATQIPQTTTHAADLLSLHPTGTAVQPAVVSDGTYSTVARNRAKDILLDVVDDPPSTLDAFSAADVPAYVRWWVGRIPRGTYRNAEQAGHEVISAWYYYDRLYHLHHSTSDAYMHEPLVYAEWSFTNSSTIIRTTDPETGARTGWPYQRARLAVVETYPIDRATLHRPLTGLSAFANMTDEEQSWRCPRYEGGAVASLEPEPFNELGPLGRIYSRGPSDVGHVVSTYPYRVIGIGRGSTTTPAATAREVVGESWRGYGYRVVHWQQRDDPTFVQLTTALAWYEPGVDAYLSLDTPITPIGVSSTLRATWEELDGTRWSCDLSMMYVAPGTESGRYMYAATGTASTPGIGDWPGHPRAEIRPLVSISGAASGELVDAALSSIDGSTGGDGDVLLAGYAAGEYVPHDVVRAIATPGITGWTIADEVEWIPDVVGTVLSLATSCIVWTPQGFAVRDFSHVPAAVAVLDDDVLTSPPAMMPTTDVITGIRFGTADGRAVVRNPRAAQKRGDDNMIELDLTAATVTDISTAAAKMLGFFARYRPTVSCEIAGELADTLTLLDTVVIECRYLARTVITVTDIERDYIEGRARLRGVVRYTDEVG